MNLTFFIKNLSLRLCILSALIIISSCSDLYKSKPKPKQQVKLCELKVKNFSKILTQNIEKDIECAAQSIHLYMNLTRTQKPGELSRVHLHNMIEKNFKGTGDLSSIRLIIDFIFDLNFLMYGEEENYLTKETVDKFYFLAIELNRVFVKYNLKGLFTSDQILDIKTFKSQRDKVEAAALHLKQKFLEQFANPKKVASFFLLRDYINKAHSLLDPKFIQKANSLLFMKKFFFGGDKRELAQDELFHMVEHLPKFLGSIYTLFVFDNIKDKNNFSFFEKSEILLELFVDYKLLILKQESSETVLMNKLELLEFIRLFAPEYERIFKHDKFYLRAKEIFFGNQNSNLLIGDFNKLLEEFNHILKMATAYKGYFKNYEDLLYEGKDFFKVSFHYNVISPKFNSDKSVLFLNQSLPENEKEFLRIFSQYRYFKGGFALPYFSSKKRFNYDGIIEFYVLEYIVKKFFKFYGKMNSDSMGGKRLSQVDLERIIEELNDLLIGEEIVLPGREKNSAETAMLVISLFQNQSNGDLYIDIGEAVEFGVSILAGLEVGDLFLKQMQKLCIESSECQLDRKDRVPAEFFRKKFINVFFHKDQDSKKEPLAHYFPRVSSYFSSLFDLKKDDFRQDYYDFLIETAAFSRVCTHYSNGEEIPMGSNDMLAVFGGMINVEQTFARFDVNANNLLEYEELKKAYDEVYKRALEALVPLNLIGKSEQIFMYLVKHRSLPAMDNLSSALKAFWGIFINAPKPNSDRLTIATILKTISELSPMSINFPPDCDSFK